ncbi:hypothetical protein RUM43_000838 [Polyplax serrata]|uniref:MaoC-like domain-containing protein n=1 Tax=Polyplax serrata TaxID=468196 RepID=A0AAN8SF53_POLSC
MIVRNIFQQFRCYSLKVGDKVSVRRRITAEDVRIFSNLTKDHNPIHSDPNKGIVHGAFLNGLVSGVIGTALPGFGTVVVEQNLRFPKPCYTGDEVTIDVIIKSVRKIVEVEFHVSNGNEINEQIVLEGTAKLLIPFQRSSKEFKEQTNFYGHNYVKN